MIEGACLCGAVGFEVAGPLPHLTHCHCATCRKHHGAPFATFAEVAPTGFRWVRGEGSSGGLSSGAGHGRRFCPSCGSVAPSDAGGCVRVPVANLEPSAVLGALGSAARGGLHAFVGERPVWHVIADALPRYEGASPEAGNALGCGAARGAAASNESASPAGAERTVSGSCGCGAVAFSVRGAPARWLQCHCSRCRRGRSAAHGSNTFYPIDHFTWLRGRELVASYRPPDAARFTVSFCARCGGGAPVERQGVPFVLIPAALFDADPGARPEGHIFFASKAPWYTIQDDLPQFAELPPS